MTYTITFEQAVAHGACRDGVTRMRAHLGADWPDDKPFPLTTVLDVSGLSDALWGLSVVDAAAVRLVASDFAAHVAHLNPDPRVAAAIRAARDFAGGRVTAEQLAAACDASWSAWDSAWDSANTAANTAARAAAWAAEAAAEAAAYAARAAAGDAAQAWQVPHLRAVLAGAKVPGRVRIRKGTGNA